MTVRIGAFKENLALPRKLLLDRNNQDQNYSLCKSLLSFLLKLLFSGKIYFLQHNYLLFFTDDREITFHFELTSQTTILLPTPKQWDEFIFQYTTFLSLHFFRFSISLYYIHMQDVHIYTDIGKIMYTYSFHSYICYFFPISYTLK